MKTGVGGGGEERDPHPSPQPAQYFSLLSLLFANYLNAWNRLLKYLYTPVKMDLIYQTMAKTFYSL